MRNNKLLFLALFICILINIFFLNHISGVLLMISNIILLSTLMFNYKKNKDIFSPLSIVFISFMISFSIKGVYIFYINKFSLDDLILPLIYYIIFLFFMALGISLKPLNLSIKEYKYLSWREIDVSKVKKFSLLFSILAILIFWLRLGTLDINFLINNLLNNRKIFQNSGGLYFQTIMLLMIQSALYINIIVYYSKNKYFNKLVFLIVLFLNFFITFLLGGRGLIIIPIIIIIFLRYKFIKKIDWIYIVGLGLFFIMFSGWYGLFRDGLKTTNIISINTLVKFIQNVLNRYVQFDNFIRLVNKDIDFLFGKSIIDFIFSPIPRSLFPEKPYPFNSQMTQIILPNQFKNWIVSDFTMLGELLVNFDLIGLVFGGWFFGYIINNFNKLYNVSKSNFFYFWYPFMILKPMSMIYGGIINSTVNMMILLETPILILIWLIFTVPRKNKTLNFYNNSINFL